MAIPTPNLKIQTVKIGVLKNSEFNARKWSETKTEQLTEGLRRFGFVNPLLVNEAPGRENVVLSGNFRLKIARDLGLTEVPVVHLNIPDIELEKELTVRLNKNLGDWDYDLLAEYFDDSMLADWGFISEELDEIFDEDVEEKETFDIRKALDKAGVQEVKAKTGDIYQLGDSRLMVGDSTVEVDVLKLMNGEKADMCCTDPPYLLDYLNAKRHGKPTDGFGSKKNRRYIGTDELPPNFTELWMGNIAKVAKDDFSIICYENWKNLKTIWAGLEANGWKVRNMLIWHLPNRNQGYAAKYKFFSKYDIAMIGSSGTVEYNHEDEVAPLQEMYESALFATSGSPQWEGYEKGKKYQPTDHITFNAADEKSSGQGVIFGIKPLEILVPYIKVLTKRGDLVVEPFCGSGSTLIAAIKLKRRCYIMEKQPIYAEVALTRWEKETGLKRVLIHENKGQKEATTDRIGE
jgi:DNA modification methylase